MTLGCSPKLVGKILCLKTSHTLTPSQGSQVGPDWEASSMQVGSLSTGRCHAGC